MTIAANNLVTQFCKSIGMEGIGLDEQGQRSLIFDEKLVVTFLGSDDDTLTALSFLADCAHKPEVMTRLLEQNFLAEAHGGARFALEPKTSRVIMTRSWNAIRTTVPEISDDLEKMVNSGMQAQEFIEKGEVTSTTTTTPDASNGAPVDSLAAAYQSI
jgi:hypothetical protein